MASSPLKSRGLMRKNISLVAIVVCVFASCTPRAAEPDLIGDWSGVLNTGGNAGGLIATPIVAYLSAQHAWTLAFLIGIAFAVASAAGWLLVDPTRRINNHTD